MNVKDIKDIIRLVNDSGLIEVDIESDGVKLSIKKPCLHPTPQPVQVVVAPANVQHAPASHSQTGGPVVSRDEVPQVSDDGDDDRIVIPSPMVGTFYRCSGPGAAPFVEIGQTIQAGQAVCIIEAMKLMNEIESEFSGRLLQVLAEDAQPVEYGQPLFVLERV